MTYKHTERACFIGYIVQAVVNNFVPLLFLTFQNQFGIPLSQVTVLITLNFLLQLAVDGASVFFIDRIGYRASALLAHGFAALGLVFLAILPAVLPSAFAGLVGVGLCGFSVGIFWPGTFSTAAASLRRGGTALFALMALAGDLGCSAGPTVAGAVAGALGDNLRAGILCGLAFPLLMTVGVLLMKRLSREKTPQG